MKLGFECPSRALGGIFDNLCMFFVFKELVFAVLHAII